MDWNTFKARRKVTLEQFVESAEDELAAIKIFSDNQIIPPLNEIADFFEKKRKQQAEILAMAKKNKAEKNNSAISK